MKIGYERDQGIVFMYAIFDKFGHLMHLYDLRLSERLIGITLSSVCLCTCLYYSHSLLVLKSKFTIIGTTGNILWMANFYHYSFKSETLICRSGYISKKVGFDCKYVEFCNKDILYFMTK